MKPEVIPNQYDGPRAPAKRLRQEGQISLDYANSDNAQEIDAGIRETVKGLRLSILAMGLGLAKLKAKGLYIDLGYHSMNDYLENLCDETQVERSTAHNWLYIGEAWIKYRKELERIEFSDADGPTKLPYVDRALEIHEKRDVFRKVKDSTLREFKEYAKGEESEEPPSKIRVVGNKVYVGKKLAVTLAKDLDPKTRGYLEKINVQAGEALEAGEVLFTTRLYDMDELRRFERGADKLKKDMRINAKVKRQ
ncbi:MAG: hypothetical protein LBH43_01635 [Treponema sp.]|jgi:hypothetical protein|nr:hypothetical protein [Treponema sp.]